MNYFVTGTDTGVGKTLISCALLHAYAAQGKRVVGMKPVAAGCDEDDLNEDVKQLRAASNILASLGQINPYSFLPPVAPHIAARNAGVRIDLARILTSYRELASQSDVVVVEGVGLGGGRRGDDVGRDFVERHALLQTLVEAGQLLAVGRDDGCGARGAGLLEVADAGG